MRTDLAIESWVLSQRNTHVHGTSISKLAWQLLLSFGCTAMVGRTAGKDRRGDAHARALAFRARSSSTPDSPTSQICIAAWTRYLMFDFFLPDHVQSGSDALLADLQFACWLHSAFVPCFTMSSQADSAMSASFVAKYAEHCVMHRVMVENLSTARCIADCTRVFARTCSSSRQFVACRYAGVEHTLAMSWLPFRRTFLDLRSLCSTCSGRTQHGLILTVLCRCCHILSCNELKLDTANSRWLDTPEAA